MDDHLLVSWVYFFLAVLTHDDEDEGEKTKCFFFYEWHLLYSSRTLLFIKIFSPYIEFFPFHLNCVLFLLQLFLVIVL